MEIGTRWATKKSVINKAIYIYDTYSSIYAYLYLYIKYSTSKRGGKNSTSRTKSRLELFLSLQKHTYVCFKIAFFMAEFQPSILLLSEWSFFLCFSVCFPLFKSFFLFSKGTDVGTVHFPTIFRYVFQLIYLVLLQRWLSETGTQPSNNPQVVVFHPRFAWCGGHPWPGQLRTCASDATGHCQPAAKCGNTTEAWKDDLWGQKWDFQSSL